MSLSSGASRVKVGRIPLEALCEPCINIRVHDRVFGQKRSLGMITAKIKLPDLSFQDVEVDEGRVLLDVGMSDPDAENDDDESFYSTERGSLSVDTMSSSGYLTASSSVTNTHDTPGSRTLSKTIRSRSDELDVRSSSGAIPLVACGRGM